MTRTNADRVVVVGASVGGSAVVQALRARGHEGPITLVGEEPHEPYERPPLSKQLLSGGTEPDRLALHPARTFEDLGVERHRSTRAVGLDVPGRRVHLAGGAVLDYGKLVIATGVTAKRPVWARSDAVHTLRTLDDALALRDALARSRRVAVVGGGVLGCEIASTAAGMGLEVMLASASPLLMEASLGRDLGAALTALHQERGVRLRTGAAVRAIEPGPGRAVQVRFADGEPEPADLVIAAVGSEPATDWLRPGAIPLGDGVECASDCSAGPGVYAVGDIARWHNERFETSMRIEHHTNAVDQARHVADRITSGDTAPYTPVPYFWTDQFGLRIQAHGHLRGHDEVHLVEGDLSTGRLVAIYRRGGRLTGVVTVGAAKAARIWRTRVEARTTWREALAMA
ncbi:NAD(P)/FAD-dependent oxidoreductase [Glycomyces sp. MUSA5-2]|uniref:NAD(P)/FAD-dependent oxidoreductase n=1 Tax=Glycomyces sp. MUSA5-2 TaxID=2053002 RepID=UPI00300927B1